MKTIADSSDSKVLDRLIYSFPYLTFLFLVAVLGLVASDHGKPAIAQSSKERTAELPSMGSAPSSPTIGGTGFKVPIPEIRMNKIVGDQAPRKAPAETSRGPVSSPAERSVSQPLHPEEPKEQMRRPGPIPMRLPFDSRYRKSTSGDIQESPVLKEEIKTDPITIQPPPEPTDRPSLRYRPPKAQEQTPEPQENQAVRTPKESAPQVQVDQPRAAERQKSEPHSPPFKGNISPVNITDSLPEPAKEIITKRMIPLPHMLEVDSVRDTIKSLPVEAQSLGQTGQELDSILMESRREPLLVEIEEPPPVEPPKEDSGVQERIDSEPKVTEPVIHEPMVPPESGQDFTVIAPKEPKPSPEIKPEDIYIEKPKEAPQAVEQPTEPQKERIPSPLDEDSAMTPELKRYLKETTPVLEELSLLMARTPSLSIADFDPSEIHAPTLPKEINLKMETMKRELRILDSKIFSIIPPQAFTQYHDLIRQSINHTYMATEAFINFFNESRIEDLKQVREHLAKAKELIHQTVE